MKRGGFSPKNYQNTQQMCNETNTQIAYTPPCFIHSVGGSVLLVNNLKTIRYDLLYSL